MTRTIAKTAMGVTEMEGKEADDVLFPEQSRL